MEQQPRIMIADDMQLMRQLLKSSLVKAGFHNIIEAADGEELLRKLDNDDPCDIIICDWDMPKMTGIDVLQYLRRDEKHKKIPFVMVSAISETDKVKQAIAAGTNDYIVKPVQPYVFVTKIKKILAELRFTIPASA